MFDETPRNVWQNPTDYTEHALRSVATLFAKPGTKSGIYKF